MKIPQFFFISCAEVTLSITAIEFAYTQAPKHMKSFMSAVWFFTVAIGNILVAFIALIPVKNVGFELLAFALVIFMIAGIFIGISIRYRYRVAPPAHSNESIQAYE
jgi:dipeptide/tripeptide permease